MIDTMHSLALIGVMAAVTVMLRFLPFLLFPAGHTLPKVLLYLGRVLPGAIMAMLVVYCFKGTVVLAYPYALPELIATTAVSIIYLKSENVLASIGVGTVLYMVLVQMIFI